MSYQRIVCVASVVLTVCLSGCGIINAFDDPPEDAQDADVGFDADVFDIGDADGAGDVSDIPDANDVETIGDVEDIDAPDTDAGVDPDIELSILSVSAEPLSVNPGETVQLEVSVDYSGNAELTYNWSAPEGWDLVSDDAAQVELVTIAEQSQTATIEVMVSAPTGESDEGDVEVSTTAVDGPQIMSIEAVPERGIPGQVQVVSVEAIHPDGYALDYEWDVPEGWEFEGDNTGESVEILSEQFDISGDVEVTVVDPLGQEISASVAVSTEELFCGGLGEELDPWEICSAKFLNRVGVYEQFFGDYFELTEDIDMQDLVDEEFHLIGEDGAPFNGVFDGAGHVIENLAIDSAGHEVGLFGRTGADAEVHNVRLHGVDIGGADQVGGLVGQNQGQIVDSSVSGDISGDGEVGGLVGRNLGDVMDSMSDASVVGNGAAIGGLVGRNTGSVEESLAHGQVVGDDLVGGLVGRSQGSISDAYATADVEAEEYAGGLLGRNESNGTVARTYSMGTVEGIARGLVGTNDGSATDITDSYWVIESSGVDTSDGGTSLEAISELRFKRNFGDAWEFYPSEGFPWVIHEDPDGHLRPMLRWEVPCSSGGASSCAAGVCAGDAGVCVPCNVDSQTDFGAGAGTSGQPWRICTTEQFENVLNADYMDHHFELFDDVVLNAEWDASAVIGSPLYGDFQGVFDGLGYRIEGVHIDGTVGDHRVGLFGTVGADGVVQNIALVSPVVSGGEQVGALVGRNEGMISNASIIGGGDVQGTREVGGLVGENAVEASISASHTAMDISQFVNSDSVGGLVGVNRGDIIDSHTTGTVEVEQGDYVGGLVGQNHDSISNSFATGRTEGEAFVGGLAGLNEGDITEAYASGNIDGERELGGLVGRALDGSITDSHATGAVAGSDSTVGGLVGYASGDSEVVSCYATGDVITDGEDAGGLIGRNNGTIIDSYATGNAQSLSGSDVGGLVGHNHTNGTITNCYATGSAESAFNGAGGLVGSNNGEIINGYATGDATGSWAGGLVGNQAGYVADSYATGTAVATDGNDVAGGFCGLTSSSAVVVDSYWDATTSESNQGVGQANSVNIDVSELETHEFDSRDPHFNDWDFNEVWVIDMAPDQEQRPIFQWQQ